MYVALLFVIIFFHFINTMGYFYGTLRILWDLWFLDSPTWSHMYLLSKFWLSSIFELTNIHIFVILIQHYNNTPIHLNEQNGWRSMVISKQAKLQFKRYNFSFHSSGNQLNYPLWYDITLNVFSLEFKTNVQTI